MDKLHPNEVARKLALLEIQSQHATYLSKITQESFMVDRVMELEVQIISAKEVLEKIDPNRVAICAARIQEAEGDISKSNQQQKHYTLSDLIITKENTMFNFKTVRFEEMDQDVVLTAAKKIFKVIYFTKHLCRQLDADIYIPSALVYTVFNKRVWDKILGEIQSNIHHRILSAKVVNIIMKKWNEDPRYPSQIMSKAERLVI